MTRKVLKYNNFKPITKFLKKFNLRSFVNKKKIHSYMNFFELDYLLKEIPDDRIKNKNPKYLIQVKNNEKKPLPYELPDLCRLHWLVLARKVWPKLATVAKETNRGMCTWGVSRVESRPVGGCVKMEAALPPQHGGASPPPPGLFS